MTDLSPGLETALEGDHVLDFYALEIVLPSYTLRLIDGAGFVAFGGHTFVGDDATYGTIGAIEAYEDGVENRSPALNVSLLPPTTTAAVTLVDPAAQGSQVSLWYGAVNPATGLVVDDPYLEFSGYLDVPVFKPQSRVLEYEIGSVWDALFPRDDGARLNDTYHQTAWPGELGFEFVSDVQASMPWGQDAPRPSVIRDGDTSGSLQRSLGGYLNSII